jgi:hypothetical protein
MALSLVLLLLANNVYAIDGGDHNRFRVSVGQHQEQPFNRRRVSKAEHVRAHHGGGRGHHRDPILPGAGTSAMDATAPSESTLAAVAPAAVAPIEVVPTTAKDLAVVSESVAASTGGKSGKASPPAPDVPQSPGEEVFAPPETSPSDAIAENATVAEGMITMMTKQALPDADNTTDMSSTIDLSGGSVTKSGKSAGGGGNVIIAESNSTGNATGVYYPAIDVSGGSGAKSGKLAGGEGNITSYGSKISKTYTGETDADMLKPKSSKVNQPLTESSKVNQPLTEFFIKESTPPAKPKSGKSAGGSVGGVPGMNTTVGKSGKYATGGKTSKTDALTSMSYDYVGDSGGMGGNIYDLLKADPNFSTFVGLVDAADLQVILKLPGLTVIGMYDLWQIWCEMLCFVQFLPTGLYC